MIKPDVMLCCSKYTRNGDRAEPGRPNQRDPAPKEYLAESNKTVHIHRPVRGILILMARGSVKCSGASVHVHRHRRIRAFAASIHNDEGSDQN